MEVLDNMPEFQPLTIINGLAYTLADFMMKMVFGLS